MRQIRQPKGREQSQVTARKPRVTEHMDRATRLSKVYSTAKWRKLREQVRQAGFKSCVACSRPSQVLDHIKPVSIAPSRVFDPRNVQPMCRACHRVKTDRIDAPNGNPSRYRHDLAHEADMRPEALRRWADEYVAGGAAAKLIGEFALDSPKLNRFTGWEPSC